MNKIVGKLEIKIFPQRSRNEIRCFTSFQGKRSDISSKAIHKARYI